MLKKMKKIKFFIKIIDINLKNIFIKSKHLYLRKLRFQAMYLNLIPDIKPNIFSTNEYSPFFV